MVSNRNSDVRSLSNFFLNTRAKAKALLRKHTLNQASIHRVFPIITSRKVPPPTATKAIINTPKDQAFTHRGQGSRQCKSDCSNDISKWNMPFMSLSWGNWIVLSKNNWRKKKNTMYSKSVQHICGISFPKYKYSVSIFKTAFSLCIFALWIIIKI
jgi:hypothetical protein